ncbi:TerB family tellurite resistance protein [Tenacibaculum sp. UWU-22]|uniref:TerB family tellurite resistance protein n=1 Tax=Tenacibaculum sp. UWU-22 TaxID=3234187 RepID=UPI0034DB1881
MGKFASWLGAGLGFTLGGPIGAIIGFTIGNFVDGFKIDGFNQGQIEYEKSRQQQARRQSQYGQAQAGDFEISLLVLASVVIKADGKIDQRELDYVRQYFVQMYGKQKANNAFKLFNGIIKKNISVRQVCIQIRENMAHASRLQLVHFLFNIAKSDGNVTASEEEEIKKIAGYLYINMASYQSIKAMFFDVTDNAYKILEITKTVSNDEVKKAYRKMAKKHHPDRLQGLGKEYIKEAEKKFQKIQEAYEKIKAERRFS